MDPRKIKLCIATPCYGAQLFAEYVSSLSDTIAYLASKGIQTRAKFIVHESLITRARNNLMAQFMALEGFTHLMFIDADIKWDARDIYAMLMKDVDVVGGIYPKKRLHLSNLNKDHVKGIVGKLQEINANDVTYERELIPHLLRYVLDAEKDQEATDSDMEAVKYIGTGFMLIKRKVIEEMIEHHKDTYNIQEMLSPEEQKFSYALFDCAIKNKNYLSEDFLFCQRWLDVGGKIYAYIPAKLTHIGLFRYQGSVEQKLYYA